ncbi:DUF1700 domain-containing protein [Sutcliffiella halmapala]|uniref:hypothetical protein n=1 Tax=Sutcliffiella halmapala TaxID=79882 RepID=UPI000994AC6C|nr:hypothetical protein [Sutcliffiella halmapala]
MIQSKQAYLEELHKELKKLPNCEELLREYDLHLSEMLADLIEIEGLEEKEAMGKIVLRFGAPKDIAACYKENLDITPTKMKWTFISVNLFFFISGISLTVMYNLLPFPFISILWNILTSIPTLLILLYMFFWVLLGYEIGKEFGLGGRKLLRNTFYFSLIPNLVLMLLVIFRVVPESWFGPLLTPSFIAICIVCTLILFPISYAAYRWGTIRSI